MTGPGQVGVRDPRRRQILKGLAAAGVAGRMPLAHAASHPADEPALEPHLAIVDPHHHIREYREPAPGKERYLAANLRADMAASGHRIEKTVFVECSTMYRTDGPAELRSLGETEYIGEMASEEASRHPQSCQIAAGIVAKVDLRYGARVEDILAAHALAAGGRLKGVRNSIAWDAYAPLAAMGLNRELLDDADFLVGFKALAPMGLTFDVWLFHPQIPALIALARRFPDTIIILDHCGNPLGIGPYAGRDAEVFAAWKSSMTALAACPNIRIKLGGLGPFGPTPTVTSSGERSRILAVQWRPYIETCIELFGAQRCMFESNWPANAGIATYGATWNTFKRITMRASNDEKDLLYRQTAMQTYGLS